MPRTVDWSLGRRITALCAAVAITLGIIALSAALSAGRNRNDIHALLEGIGPARNNALRLMSAALNQQAGLRAYAVSAKSDDLSQYDDGLSQEGSIIASLRDEVGGDRGLTVRIDTAETTLRAWRHDVADPTIASIRSGGADPSRAASTPDTAAPFQRATDAITALQQQLTDRRNVLSDRITSSSNVVLILLLCAAVVVLLAGAALALLLRQFITRPVTDLAEEVRLVAGGEYDREIHGVGPPEVVRLANDVDVMRQRIAADLAEVRAARRQVEEANRLLEEQAAELTRSNRDLEQFAYVASHDLQEPLRKVASFCQLLQRRYAGQLDERADQYIAFAVDGAQRMQRLINDLLAFSRIGRLTSGFVDVDLSKVAADAANQLEAKREEAGAEVTWDPLPTVHGEEPLLLALIANLISNSLKFRRPDVPSRIHLSARQVDGEWEISCRDNGIGISPEFSDKVFVIFQRLHAKETYPGTGIGLAIAKKIIEYHGGRIWLDTDYRDGTMIHFTLPVIAPVDGEHADPSSPASSLVDGTGVTSASAASRVLDDRPAGDVSSGNDLIPVTASSEELQS